jgi:hypothetical protein
MRNRLLLILVLIAMLGACARVCPVRTVEVPVPVQEIVRVVEPVPPGLLAEHPAEEAPAAQLHVCPDIARQRLHELRRCNADKAAIRAMREGQGTR